MISNIEKNFSLRNVYLNLHDHGGLVAKCCPTPCLTTLAISGSLSMGFSSEMLSGLPIHHIQRSSGQDQTPVLLTLQQILYQLS